MSAPIPWPYDQRNPEGRPYHDDWRINGLPLWIPQPQTWIPRRWTGYGFPMPFRQLLGNAPQSWHDVQPGYPLAAGIPAPSPALAILMTDPVPGLWQWTLQAIPLRFPFPCYFAFSFPLLGRRIHFNGGPLAPLIPLALYFLPHYHKLAALLLLIGCKPDITYDAAAGTRNWFCWFECSFGAKKI